MRSLPEDVAFVRTATALLRDAGVMRDPLFDAAAAELVEGDLRVDVANPWHLTRRLTHPRRREILDDWARPKHLGHACRFGRVDVVRRVIATGAPIDGSDGGGDPIAAAIEAWVVTPLHVACVEMLFAAGAKATLAQLDAFSAESVGTGRDLAILEMLLRAARRSDDVAVRRRAETWST